MPEQNQNSNDLRELLKQADSVLRELELPRLEKVDSTDEFQPDTVSDFIVSHSKLGDITSQLESKLFKQIEVMKNGYRASLPLDEQNAFDSLPEETRFSYELEHLLLIERIRSLKEIADVFKRQVNMEMASLMGEVEDALKYAESALKLDPDNGEAHVCRVKVYLVLNQNEKAKSALTELLTSDAGDAYKSRAQFFVDHWQK